MTGRGQVAVLWDAAHDAPPGPLLDTAALASGGWDWCYIGPPTPVRPPTMVVQRRASDVRAALRGIDIVVGVPTQWTLEHVVTSGARFVAVVLGDVGPAIAEEDVAVAGWPAAEQWPAVLAAAMALDAGHHRAISGSADAQVVADEIIGLLDEIRNRHLPAAFQND